MPAYIENIQPDSLTGAVFAIEGIRDACVILNAPTGCKFYHSAVSDTQYLRGLSFEPAKYSDAFHMTQPRVPSTYLDGHDYVFGSGEKITTVLRELMKMDYKLIAIINSPGAALIGDDLEGFLAKEVKGIPCVGIENTGYSGNYSTGYQKAIVKVLDAIALKPRMVRKKTVNLLGFHLYQKHFAENYQTVKSLLALCDIEVISAPGAGDDVETLTKMTEAEYNVVVYPEYGMEIARTFAQKYQIPFLELSEGPPIGFDATWSFVMQICEQLGTDPQKAYERIEKARAKAYLHLARFASLSGLPKGASFGIKAEASICYVLAKWLATYLGMVPAAISVLSDQEDTFVEKLSNFLGEIDASEILHQSIDEAPMHILFADGNTIASLRLTDRKVCGVEISLPSLGYIDVTEKYILGDEGTLFLLEQIINGLQFLL